MRLVDKIFVAVIIGILIIAGAAFIVEGNRTEPGYREGATPQDVVHNYLLAIQERDYERAYPYLSPRMPGYPKDVQTFVRQVNTEPYLFGLDDEVSLNVLSEKIGDAWSTVEVRESRSYHTSPFFIDRSTMTFTMNVEMVDGEWMIGGGERYIAYCWTRRVCP